MTDTLFRPEGHQDVRGWLKHVIRISRASGGYLFMGPAGIGKASLALEFAASMRCASLQDGWACGSCNECRRVAHGVHPSVRAFAKPADKSAFPVELVREIVDEASKKGLEPGQRTFIIGDADSFNESSANAFLKMLEEPPADLVFVLIAENLAQVIPTILSRCQTVRFSPLKDELVSQITRGWEGLPVNPDARALLVRAAQGSPGRLRAMADAGVLETVRDFLKTVGNDPFHASDALIASAQRADDNEGKRAQLREVIALLSAALRDRMLTSIGSNDLKPLTRKVQSEPLTTDRLVASLHRLDDLRSSLDGNANLKLCCDAIALAWPA